MDTNTTISEKMDNYIKNMEHLFCGKNLELSDFFLGKDRRAFFHGIRVMDYCFLMAQRIGLSDEEIEILAEAALFHDIGKTMMLENIKDNSSFLTDEEMVTMRTHPSLSAMIIREAGGSREAVKTIACHHERYDGRGYPYGLHGEGIPALSRIIAIADAYDTIASEHDFDEAAVIDEAMMRLIVCRGTQFDPDFVDAFIEMKCEREADMSEAV